MRRHLRKSILATLLFGLTYSALVYIVAPNELRVDGISVELNMSCAFKKYLRRVISIVVSFGLLYPAVMHIVFPSDCRLDRMVFAVVLYSVGMCIVEASRVMLRKRRIWLFSWGAAGDGRRENINRHAGCVP
jgi:hypothetical protein